MHKLKAAEKIWASPGDATLQPPVSLQNVISVMSPQSIIAVSPFISFAGHLMQYETFITALRLLLTSAAFSMSK